MKVRSHHGVGFLAGLALALSLAAQACVAGEVGDEDETEAAPSEPQAVEVQAADPPPHEQRAPAAVGQVRKADQAGVPTEVRHGGHKLGDTDTEPPPNPW